jgi:hypothetical protein
MYCVYIYRSLFPLSSFPPFSQQDILTADVDQSIGNITRILRGRYMASLYFKSQRQENFLSEQLAEGDYQEKTYKQHTVIEVGRQLLRHFYFTLESIFKNS